MAFSALCSVLLGAGCGPFSSPDAPVSHGRPVAAATSNGGISPPSAEELASAGTKPSAAATASLKPRAQLSRPSTHPLEGQSAEALAQRVKEDLRSLGSMSIGLPNSGALLNGFQLEEDPRWERVDQSHTWGTRETLDYIEAAVQRVVETHPDTPPLFIGHISGPAGGRLDPHSSHQSGRDVDLGYYYRGGGHWYQQATADTLDVARTWTLVRALIVETDVRFILMAHRVQRLVRAHAEQIGEDPDWLDDIFKGAKGVGPLIRHAPGHGTHIHVRFYNPIAQETARRCYSALVDQAVIKPPIHYIWHRVRRGESLIKLAKRYSTTVRAIQRANGLRSTKILAKKSYKIPRKGPAHPGAPVAIPPRRLPPDELTAPPAETTAAGGP